MGEMALLQLTVPCLRFLGAGFVGSDVSGGWSEVDVVAFDGPHRPIPQFRARDLCVRRGSGRTGRGDFGMTSRGPGGGRPRSFFTLCDRSVKYFPRQSYFSRSNTLGVCQQYNVEITRNEAMPWLICWGA